MEGVSEVTHTGMHHISSAELLLLVATYTVDCQSRMLRSFEPEAIREWVGE
jgi:hypothetical protein